MLYGVDWGQYEALLDVLADNFPTLRLSYLEGTLEIMTNSPEHEDLKKMIGMLVEAYYRKPERDFMQGARQHFARQRNSGV